MECEKCGFKDDKAVGQECPKCGSHKVRNSDDRYTKKPLRDVKKK